MGQVEIQTGKLDGFESRHKWDNQELNWVDLRFMYMGDHEGHMGQFEAHMGQLVAKMDQLVVQISHPEAHMGQCEAQAGQLVAKIGSNS